MSVYVVGDIQGCFKQLKSLLEKVDFCPSRDKLIALGDMVNRGPESLQVLRFCMDLESSFNSVLGNHDFHLLVLYHKIQKSDSKDTLKAVLQAKDIDAIVAWLKQKNLVLFEQNYLLVHAGLHPSWDRQTALGLSAEVSQSLVADSKFFVENLYGDKPKQWSNELEGIDRIRCIVNICTRMRFLEKKNNILDFSYKGNPKCAGESLQAWFEFPRASVEPIIFGHWAALEGKTYHQDIHALDTGCVWGGELTMLDLTTKELISIGK